VAFHVNYTFLDRVIHRIAFLSPAVQLTAADIEKAIFASAYRDVTISRPVFITSLPRAGTTVLLDAVAQLPSVCTHVYRDMPFVLAPIFWARLTGPFRQRAESRERAHADGVLVSEDSAEAFEEVLWRALWPHKYGRERIELWSVDDCTAEALAQLLEHMRKIVALRRPGNAVERRYASKNNANIARLPLLRRMFPDASVVVPIRHPLQHARSLLRQHRNFLALHAQEAFARRYMEDIGHYEFGKLHRPIRFPGLDALIGGRSPLTLDYWLGYWIAAFEHVREHRHVIIPISYEALCARPQAVFSNLLGHLGIAVDDRSVQAGTANFHLPLERPSDDEPDGELLRRAERLHQTLVNEPLEAL
jgi:hypothetical protein